MKRGRGGGAGPKGVGLKEEGEGGGGAEGGWVKEVGNGAKGGEGGGRGLGAVQKGKVVSPRSSLSPHNLGRGQNSLVSFLPAVPWSPRPPPGRAWKQWENGKHTTPG